MTTVSCCTDIECCL